VFATFKTSTGRKTGMVIKINTHTVLVKQIDFGEVSLISKHHRLSVRREVKKKKIKKDEVQFYPEYIIPIF
jgi:hypothetical protein